MDESVQKGYLNYQGGFVEHFSYSTGQAVQGDLIEIYLQNPLGAYLRVLALLSSRHNTGHIAKGKFLNVDSAHLWRQYNRYDVQFIQLSELYKEVPIRGAIIWLITFHLGTRPP
ncbi:hypothetical protein EYC80_005666 [Monilinia laxa]|uniref:Uncharacterized protein n=1 Tax=Monilinia laxa TaxID=61186 RepID=A0A5N6KF58_MONLA|nr:hypothetical protein EYC80_005666 [Monilinia laxa]